MLGRPVPELGGGRDGLVHERPAGDVHHVEQNSAAAAPVPALQQRSLDDVQSQVGVLLMQNKERMVETL